MRQKSGPRESLNPYATSIYDDSPKKRKFFKATIAIQKNSDRIESEDCESRSQNKTLGKGIK